MLFRGVVIIGKKTYKQVFRESKRRIYKILRERGEEGKRRRGKGRGRGEGKGSKQLNPHHHQSSLNTLISASLDSIRDIFRIA